MEIVEESGKDSSTRWGVLNFKDGTRGFVLERGKGGDCVVLIIT